MPAEAIARSRTDPLTQAMSPGAVRGASGFLFLYHVAMMSRIHRAALALICATTLASPASAADDRQTTTRIPTVTRLVKLFIERETALAAAIRAGDAAKTQAFLSDDFEMRTGAMAGTPVPRAEWIAEMMRLRDPGGD